MNGQNARRNGISVPLRRHPKGKGNGGELEVVKLLHGWGWHTARRNFASGGQGGADIIGGPQDVAIEVKRTERCTPWAWIEQVTAAARPTESPVVFFRRNRSPWYVIVPAHDYLELLANREQVGPHA